MKYLGRKCIVIFILLICCVTILPSQNNFTLVIDAGHGGRDPGALGKTIREKDLNLAVALKLGKLIESNHSNVKVIYTRKTDVFIPLIERADVANKNKANLFISIHANAADNKNVHGTETYALGSAKSKANLEVAMRENSVILLEDDYETKYEGFNPSSIESYIMFELMQDRYLDKSLEFASLVQNNFTSDCKRNNRGVKQAPYVVLHRSACPSVLIELGFISNINDEKYMGSEKGQNELADAISKAFTNYKHNYDKRSGIVTSNKGTSISNVSQSDKPVFKIQLFATKKELKSNASDFKGLKETEYFIENDWYKYTTGNTSNYNEIVNLQKEIKSKFPDAFIIAFDGNKKISVKEARKILENK